MPYGTANYQSGINGFVQIGTTLYRFGKWNLDMEAKYLPVNNFSNVGGQFGVAGISRGELTLEAKTWDAGNMAFVCGTTYTFVLGASATQLYTLSIFVEKISVGSEYEGLVPVKISGQTQGVISPAIA